MVLAITSSGSQCRSAITDGAGQYNFYPIHRALLTDWPQCQQMLCSNLCTNETLVPHSLISFTNGMLTEWDVLLFLFFETALLLLHDVSTLSVPLTITSRLFNSLRFLFFGSFSPSKNCLYSSSNKNLFFCFSMNISILISIVFLSSRSACPTSVTVTEGPSIPILASRPWWMMILKNTVMNNENCSDLYTADPAVDIIRAMDRIRAMGQKNTPVRTYSTTTLLWTYLNSSFIIFKSDQHARTPTISRFFGSSCDLITVSISHRRGRIKRFLNLFFQGIEGHEIMSWSKSIGYEITYGLNYTREKQE